MANYREAWQAILLIRECVESHIVGAMPSEEQLHDIMMEAEAIVLAIDKIAVDKLDK